MESLPRYRTGDEGLDRAISEIIELSGAADDHDMLFETIVSTLRMGRERVGRGDLKLVNAALKELRYAFLVFEPYRNSKKCTIFGSARTQPSEASYVCARDFGEAMAAQDWMVMTGAGPGIMAAGLEGAGTENSFGINIQLPFESGANEFIAGDPKLINFRYFFTRKLTFMKESHGYALLPGGFGTMDEAFELLTLMQTGKTFLAPVVLLDPPGNSYWDTWKDFVTSELLGQNLISESDLDLVYLTDDVDAGVAEICKFYNSYHSCRYVGNRLIMRLTRELSDNEIADLNNEFGDMLEEGQIERTEVTKSELDDNDSVDLHRLGMRFNRMSHARLRQMVDVINETA